MMKFAFSTAASPEWDMQTTIARAKSFGFDGVELSGMPVAGDAATVRLAFADAGLRIAAIVSPIAFSGVSKADRNSADLVRPYIDQAAAMGCGIVKMSTKVFVPMHRDPTTVAAVFGNWVALLADYAAEHDLMLAIENEYPFHNSRILWTVLEAIDHPALAAAWNVGNAFINGERPALSVPTLNSRIQYATVKDVKMMPDGPQVCPIGQGNVPVRKFLLRLGGIGYSGWVSVEWDRTILPGLAPAEDILPQALATLRAYLTPPKPTHGPAAHTKKATPAAP